MSKFQLFLTAILATCLIFNCQFCDCKEKTFQEMLSGLLENQQIPWRLKQRILHTTVSYLQREMTKFANNRNICPKHVPKDLCQTPPTFYVWMRKLRDEIIQDEINKSKSFAHFLFLKLFNILLSTEAKILLASLLKMATAKESTS